MGVATPVSAGTRRSYRYKSKIFSSDMKKIFILAVLTLVPLMASAQAQIVTKKMKLEDFPEKITKVVLTGNGFYDETLKDEIRGRWHVSPFEFCTMDEFNSMKTSPDYYFLVTVKGQFRKESEPGIEMLSLVKGGEGADKSIDNMLEVVTIPVCSADSPSGRELVYMPALLDIIQEQVVLSMEKDVNAYTGLSNYTIQLSKADKFNIIFSEDDLSSEITDKTKQLLFDKYMSVDTEENVDDIFMSDAPQTLVSYTVAPSDPVIGSYCYKMLIDSETHKLYYYRKHRITKKTGAGFLYEDIKRIASR